MAARIATGLLGMIIKTNPRFPLKSGLTMCDYLPVSCTVVECCIVEVDYKHKLITNDSLLAYANEFRWIFTYGKVS